MGLESSHENPAVALCVQADHLPPAEQERVLDAGYELAEAAVAANDADAHAYFALFCNLGKKLRLSGVSFGSLEMVKKVKRAIDAALRLDPTNSEFLTAKGVLLIELPRWLGGDRERGAQLLRRSLKLDPANRTALEQLRELEND